jgi:hypothetical protein
MISTALLLCGTGLLAGGCRPAELKEQPPDRLTVEYSIDRDRIRVGDPALLDVTVYYPTNGVLQMPELGREKDVILLNRDWHDTPREDGLSQTDYRYSLTSFRIGEHAVSTGLVTCAVGKETLSAAFPGITLSVTSSLPDEASSELADIKPVHRLPGRVPLWLWVALGTALAAFGIGWLTSRLWKHREYIMPSPPTVPPHVIALKALETLQRKGLLEQNECNPFYTELSLILRTYLEGRFRLNAPDETTEEIVEEMSRSSELNDTQRMILQDFMRQADMVKFARGHPDRTTMESAFDTTRQFVEETKTPENKNED